MGEGGRMIDHINYIKTLAEHLEAVDDEMAEKIWLDCFKRKADAENDPKNVTASRAKTRQENGKVNEETATEFAFSCE
eukprot:gene1881-16379_t